MDPPLRPIAKEERSPNQKQRIHQRQPTDDKPSKKNERPKTRERPSTRDKKSNPNKPSNRNVPLTKERPATENSLSTAIKGRPSTREGTPTKRITGTVKWFNVKDGYGFITRHDTGEDVFVHKSSIMRPNSRHMEKSIGDGEVVEFGLIASKVTGPGFTRVKGSPFVAPKKEYKSRPTSSQTPQQQNVEQRPKGVGDGSSPSDSKADVKIKENLNLIHKSLTFEQLKVSASIENLLMDPSFQHEQEEAALLEEMALIEAQQEFDELSLA
ncbi:Y-box-binding protein 2-like [Uranotaenia lowii]|uniref:Y-box-binding protein 2-like n=1 Tax=Uranotaenia lowii TaxID=190385 RepID=UPI0024783988|nr:Y-box-binding protein 2-like [Uranotaenia lowii]